MRQNQKYKQEFWLIKNIQNIPQTPQNQPCWEYIRKIIEVVREKKGCLFNYTNSKVKLPEIKRNFPQKYLCDDWMCVEGVCFGNWVWMAITVFWHDRLWWIILSDSHIARKKFK